jgi:hypothetical protein
VTMPTIDRVHTFNREQKVKFVGGEGIVRNFKFEAERWLYVVEMPLGQEPAFGRIGAETMVLLSETELRAAQS